MVKWDENWVEVFTLLFIVLGFIISVFLRNISLSLTSIMLGGFLSARVYYFKKSSEPILPFILMIVGFLIGYLLGSFWISRIWVLIFFAIGYAISYYLHKKEILVIFKSKNFIR